MDRVVAAVDASLETIEGLGAASDSTGARPLLLVHHGLFWDGNVPLTGRRYRRIRALLDRDVALYAAHIPLDVHPEVGNNVVLARRLGLPVEGWFGNYRGVPIGVMGAAPPALADGVAWWRRSKPTSTPPPGSSPVDRSGCAGWDQSPVRRAR